VVFVCVLLSGVVVWWCGGVVVWWCGPVVLWSCGPVVLWSCGVVVLWCCGVSYISLLTLWKRYKNKPITKI